MSAKTVQLNRRELYDMIWSEAVSKVGARYDLSDIGASQDVHQAAFRCHPEAIGKRFRRVNG